MKEASFKIEILDVYVTVEEVCIHWRGIRNDFEICRTSFFKTKEAKEIPLEALEKRLVNSVYYIFDQEYNAWNKIKETSESENKITSVISGLRKQSFDETYLLAKKLENGD